MSHPPYDLLLKVYEAAKETLKSVDDLFGYGVGSLHPNDVKGAHLRHAINAAASAPGWDVEGMAGALYDPTLPGSAYWRNKAHAALRHIGAGSTLKTLEGGGDGGTRSGAGVDRPVTDAGSTPARRPPSSTGGSKIIKQQYIAGGVFETIIEGPSAPTAQAETAKDVRSELPPSDAGSGGPSPTCPTCASPFTDCPNWKSEDGRRVYAWEPTSAKGPWVRCPDPWHDAREE